MTMPEFEISIDATRSLTCTIKVTVTADDEDAAYDEALDQATNGELSKQMESRWETSHTDFNIAKVEEQDEETPECRLCGATAEDFEDEDEFELDYGRCKACRQ